MEYNIYYFTITLILALPIFAFLIFPAKKTAQPVYIKPPEISSGSTIKGKI
ncbi:hypothetical protein BH09BAC6_BH09BAC6_23320 [soil metagenome]